MNIERNLSKVTRAVTEAGETAAALVTGPIAGIGADWIDKFFLTEEDGSHFETSKKERKERKPKKPLGRKKAEKLAHDLTSHVSIPPNELII